MGRSCARCTAASARWSREARDDRRAHLLGRGGDRPLPRRRGGWRGPAGREAGDCPLLRHLPPLGRDRHHTHVLAQLAPAPVGLADGPGAGWAAMRIYIAARYDRRWEMLGVASDLLRAGHDVTSRWIEGRG